MCKPFRPFYPQCTLMVTFLLSPYMTLMFAVVHLCTGQEVSVKVTILASGTLYSPRTERRGAAVAVSNPL